MNFKNKFFAVMLAGTVGIFGANGLAEIGLPSLISQAHAAQVKVIVNSNPITTVDIANRVAFLKLQQRKGNLNKLAQDELVEEMLKRVEMKTRGINISDQEVDAAYAGFASRNNMSTAQLTQIMNQSGITPKHFKTFIMVQMGWGRAVNARFRADGIVSEQDAVQRMLQQGGKKPSATEYTLQQVIFVVPNSKRSPATLSKRRQEANAFRTKVNDCSTTRQKTKGLMDVTVRDLGRVLEQELPDEWSKQVKAIGAGKTTPAQDTDKGVEFLTVCSTRQISDDRVAQLVFSLDGDGKPGGQDQKAEEISKKYVKELRDKARIINR